MKVMIAGGGTAGHINPGLAIAQQIQKHIPEAEFLFIGTKRGLETRLVPEAGYPLATIDVRGFRRKLSLDTLKSVSALFRGMVQVRKILRDFRPDIVIGTGGYVAGPVLAQAAWMDIPTLIHEQNAFPGVTNRILSRWVDIVALSYEESAGYFSGARRAEHTGNPVRESFKMMDASEARKRLQLPADRKIVVAVGGSLGAKSINDSVMDMVLKSNWSSDDFHVVLASGDKQFKTMTERLSGAKPEGFMLKSYLSDADLWYSAADVLVCRAGAMTCTEICRLGVPAILVPFPGAAGNHQEHNARSLADSGAAVMIKDDELHGDYLYETLREMFSQSGHLEKMRHSACAAAVPDAEERLWKLVSELVTVHEKNPDA